MRSLYGPVEPRRLPRLTGGKVRKLRGEGIYNRADRDGGRRVDIFVRFRKPLVCKGIRLGKSGGGLENCRFDVQFLDSPLPILRRQQWTLHYLLSIRVHDTW